MFLQSAQLNCDSLAPLFTECYGSLFPIANYYYLFLKSPRLFHAATLFRAVHKFKGIQAQLHILLQLSLFKLYHLIDDGLLNPYNDIWNLADLEGLFTNNRKGNAGKAMNFMVHFACYSLPTNLTGQHTNIRRRFISFHGQQPVWWPEKIGVVMFSRLSNLIKKNKKNLPKIFF